MMMIMNYNYIFKGIYMVREVYIIIKRAYFRLYMMGISSKICFWIVFTSKKSTNCLSKM